MYACLLETGAGFFGMVCAAGHRLPFSCDPPPMLSDRAGVLLKGLRFGENFPPPKRCVKSKRELLARLADR
jgi:hypothetical protein